jgi:hypothetical protein
MATADFTPILALPPDWDGYGSPPIHPGAVAAAARFLAALPDDIPRPHIVPMSYGRVQLEWHRGPVSLEVEFVPDGGLEYLRWDIPRGVSDVEECPTWDDAVARDLWGWFVRSTGG